MIQITDNQRALILLAVETGGQILNFPDNLRGGARTAVTRSLVLNDLIAADGAGYALTDAGYAAVGLAPPATDADTALDVDGSDTAEDRGQSEPTGDHSADDAVSHSEPDQNTLGADDANGSATEPNQTTKPKPTKSEKTTKPVKQGETRIEQVVALMLRPEGVTIAQVMEVTGWQQHSVRGFFAGTLKKKGYTVINEKDGKEARVYRIKTEEAKGAAAPTSGDEEE